MKENKKVLHKMRLFLLGTAAVLAFNQWLLSAVLLITTVYALYYMNKKSFKASQVEVLPKSVVLLLSALAFFSWISLHFIAEEHRNLCTLNFVYVVGQYGLIVWLISTWGGKLAVEDSIKGRRFSLQLLKVLGSAALVVSFLGILQHFMGGVTDNLWIDKAINPDIKVRVYSTWENPNIFAGYLCAFAAYLMAFISVEKERKKRLLFWLSLGVAVLALIFTYSRGFMLALVAEVVLFILFYYRKGIIPVLMGGTVFAGFMGQTVWNRLATLGHISADSSAAMRLAYWDIACSVFKDHPWGTGWYSYQYVFPEYDYYFHNPDVIMYHCHNLFLNIAVETGLQGLLLFVLLLFYFLYRAYLLSQSDISWIKAAGRGYLLMVAGIFVGGIGDYVYFNVRMGILFWLLSTVICLIAAEEKLWRSRMS